MLCRACCPLQENFFFDGPNKELNSRLVVLRLRFYDTDKKALLTLKVCACSSRVATALCLQHALLLTVQMPLQPAVLPDVWTLLHPAATTMLFWLLCTAGEQDGHRLLRGIQA